MGKRNSESWMVFRGGDPERLDIESRRVFGAMFREAMIGENSAPSLDNLEDLDDLQIFGAVNELCVAGLLEVMMTRTRDGNYRFRWRPHHETKH